MNPFTRHCQPIRQAARLSIIVLCVIVTGCASSIAHAAEGPKADPALSQVTIGVLNTENFFDRHNDPYTDDQGTDPKTEEEMAALGKVISHMQADFVGLVEVETQGLLWAFKNKYLAEQGYDDVFVGHRDYGRGINNGAMSRVPIQTVYNYHFRKLRLPDEDRYWRFARDVVAFDIEPKTGVTMRIYVVHFKSKRDSRGDPNSAKWRLAEATEVRRILEKQLRDDPDALFAVIGDFNDTPKSDPVQTLLTPDEKGRPVLVDVHAGLPADKRVTYLREPYRSTIDYIFVSPAMAKLFKPGSAKVYSDDGVLDGTDHAGLTATFVLPDED